MEITINGKTADVILEKEKTIGDVLAALENWIRGSGHYLSGFDIDGKSVDSASVSLFFEHGLSGVGVLDIRTSSWAELAAEALAEALQYLDDYGKAGFEERGRLSRAWSESPSSQFLKAEIPDLHGSMERTLSGEGLGAAEASTLAVERMRELNDPFGELGKVEPLIEGIAGRLEDLPLDIQTGKDAHAAETIQLFSRIAEKLFRIFNLFKALGFSPETFTVGGAPVYDYIDEFSAALKELLAAYETKDAVLVGDLAEYELAPRLRKFYAAIKTPIGLSA
jgi:hypothetical protein